MILGGRVFFLLRERGIIDIKIDRLRVSSGALKQGDTCSNGTDCRSSSKQHHGRIRAQKDAVRTDTTDNGTHVCSGRKHVQVTGNACEHWQDSEVVSPMTLSSARVWLTRFSTRFRGLASIPAITGITLLCNQQSHVYSGTLSWNALRLWD